MKKDLFSKNCVYGLKNRIGSLHNDTIPNWGKMNVSQMLAHCSGVLRNALGETQQKRKLIGYFVAPFFKHRYYDAKPYKIKGGPTTVIIQDDRDFEYEKQNLIKLIEKFHYGNREKLKDSINPILGKFTPEQWAIGQYKHIDHHLRQFGV